jgi:hypothetical protein
LFAGSSGAEGSPAGGAGHEHRSSSRFRNRERELEDVLHALRNEDADHFWLVIAPPQLGKSWFLREIGDRVHDYVTRCRVWRVDVREHPAEAGDALALLALMYGATPSARDTHVIARDIIGSGRYNLCLLDSAELLSQDTIRELRAGLGEIKRYVDASGSRYARLALVAASRRDRPWRGIMPPPRLAVCQLTEFKQEVVFDAVNQLALEMGRQFGRAEVEEYARLVHRLSEGLPALLARYLDWIQQEQWIDLPRLAERDRFDELASPYIEQQLLSPNSLFGELDDPPDGLREALIESVSALSPYRFLTMTHLSHHAARGKLPDALRKLGWQEEELWAGVSGTDLLQLPQDELWHEISPPIRRLLCRHWYGSEASRAQAHRHAAEFLESFADGLAGRERARVVIECLWHEAEALNLSQDADRDGKLLALAARLSRNLVGQPGSRSGAVSGFRDSEVRDFTVRRMEDDEELTGAIGDAALFQSIAGLILRPDEGTMS